MDSQDPILLVEDSDDDLFLFQRAWRRVGPTNPLVVARDGVQALAHFQPTEPPTPRPAVVFVDLKIPRKDGFDVIQGIREREPSRRTILICLTSSHQVTDVRRAYESGANSYLVKPSDILQLENMLRAFRQFWVEHSMTL